MTKDKLKNIPEVNTEPVTFVYGARNEQLRELWIADKLSELPKGTKILDAGAGDQHHRKLCDDLGLIYTSQDNAKYNGIGDNSGLQTGNYDYGDIDIKSDITSIPLPDGSFSAVMCTEVLEHVVNPEAVIKELSRLLEQDGTLLLTAPFSSLTHFAPYHYFTGFNHYWYMEVLPKYGLQVQTIQHYGDFFEYLVQELRRLPYIKQTYCPDVAVTLEEETALNNVVELLFKLGGDTSNLSWQVLTYGYMVIAKKIF